MDKDSEYSANTDPKIKVEIFDFGETPNNEEIHRWLTDVREGAKDAFLEDDYHASVAMFLAPDPKDESKTIRGVIRLTCHMGDPELDSRLAPFLQKLNAFILIQIHIAWCIESENDKPINTDDIYKEYGSIQNHPDSTRVLTILETTGYGSKDYSFRRMPSGELEELGPSAPNHGRLVGWLKPRVL